jgi:thioesterase domain-containing protein
LPSRLHDVERVNRRIIADYSSPVYDGAITLFRADVRLGPHDGRLVWLRLAKGGVDIRNIGGEGIGHVEMMYDPHAATLAREIEVTIAAAEAAHFDSVSR